MRIIKQYGTYYLQDEVKIIGGFKWETQAQSKEQSVFERWKSHYNITDIQDWGTGKPDKS